MMATSSRTVLVDLPYSVLPKDGEGRREIYSVDFVNRVWVMYLKFHMNSPNGSSKYFLYVYGCPALETGESAEVHFNPLYSHKPNQTSAQTFHVTGNGRRSKYGPYVIKICLGEEIRHRPLQFGIKALTFDDILPSRHPISTSFDFFRTMSEYLENYDLSDVSLRVGEKTFPAHKILLSTASPVFKAMFESNFSESCTNVVEIKDFEPETIKEMLKFIYTHQSPKFSISIDDSGIRSLYKVAHKYDVKPLLKLCRSKLLLRMDISNVLDSLILADIYDDQLLKTNALTFVCKNPLSITDDDNFNTIMQQRPLLFKDIFVFKFLRKV